MTSTNYLELLKKNRRKPVQTIGLPGLNDERLYSFDIFRDNDRTFCVRIHDWNYIGRDQIQEQPGIPEQLNFISKFGISFKTPEVLMFSSLTAFENFLNEILPLAINLDN